VVTLDRLAEAIGALERGRRRQVPDLTTGWSDGSGGAIASLARGCIHEWCGGSLDHPDPATTPRDHLWVPPLALMIHLAWRAIESDDAGAAGPGGGHGRIIWIGRRCWPYAHALLRPRSRGQPPGLDHRLLDRSLLIDPPDDAARLWAADLALRSGAGVAMVIADAGRLDMSGSRRLQLAAEAGLEASHHGGPVGLLLRPPWEHKHLSASATRWMVHAAGHRSSREDGAPVWRHVFDEPLSLSGRGAPILTPSPPGRSREPREPHEPAAHGYRSGGPRWSVELLRCKGKQPAPDTRRQWLLELDRARCVVCVLPALADRPAAPARAAG
jgi:hypothetical protein